MKYILLEKIEKYKKIFSSRENRKFIRKYIFLEKIEKYKKIYSGTKNYKGIYSFREI